jgi:hypothetical protein
MVSLGHYRTDAIRVDEAVTFIRERHSVGPRLPRLARMSSRSLQHGYNC